MELNKTQIKKINQAKIWFKKSDKYAIDDAVKRFNTQRTKDNVLSAYCTLHKSFKNHCNFLKAKSLVESSFSDSQKDYIKLAKLLKQFIKSFNLN